MKKNIFFFVLVIVIVSCESVGDFPLDNLPGKFINAMTLDSKGALWFATSEIDTSIHLPLYSSSLPVRYYLTRLYENSITVVDNHFVGVKEMTTDKNGKLWFITSNTLYFFSDNKPTEVYKLSEEMGSFGWITTDQDKNIWVGGLGTPLLKVTNEPEIKIFNIANRLLSSTAGHFDSNNNLWIALWTKWIGKLDPNGEWTYYNPSNSSIPDQNYWCITSDKDNNIWAGTGGLNNNASNLVMFNGTNWKQITPKDDKGNRIYGTVRQLYYDGKRIWIVSEIAVNSAFDSGYLVTFDGENWNRIYETPLKDGISGIELDLLNNRAWIGTFNSGCISISLK